MVKIKIHPLLILTLAIPVPSIVLAQGPPPESRTLPPGAIDGSQHPELIPDLTANRLVLRAFVEPPNASQAQLARQ